MIKFIGLLLAFILLLFLLLILLVLFVPVRYEGNASFYEETPKADVRISWLFRLISLCVRFEDAVDCKVKLLGRQVLPKNKRKQKKAQNVSEKEAEPEKKPASRPEPLEKLEAPMEVRQPLPPGPKEIDKPVYFEENEEKEEKEEKGPSVKARAEAISRKLSSIKAFLSDEENKKTLKLIKKELFHLIFKLRPRRLKCYLHFGFKDPYITGQVLAYASLLYAFYYKNVTLEPEFERAVLEGDLYFKGRFCLATGVRVGGKLLLNKNLRSQVKKFMNR